MPNSRVTPFSRVLVDHLTSSGSRIQWELARGYILCDPHTFQLQVNETGVSSADDWVDVGSAVSNTFVAYDDTKREFGKAQTTHYRIKFVDPNGTHYSEAVGTYGLLRKRDWMLAASILRREQLRHGHYTSPDGYLLRRKWSGTVPAENTYEVDPLTGEPVKSQGSSTHGTEFVGGYYAPVPFHVDLSPVTRNIHQDPNRGTVNDTTVQGRCVPFPQINRKDVWVHASSNVRYAVQTIQHTAEVRGVPIVVGVTLGPLSRKDPVYSVDVPD